MVEPEPMNPLVARLDEIGAKKGWSRERIAKEARLDRGFLHKLAGRGPRASVRAETLVRLAEVVGVHPDELLALAASARSSAARGPEAAAPTPDIPVRGIVAGSVLGSFRFTGDAIDYVDRPPALARVPDAYAVYVENESMSPMHMPGDLRFVHPHKPPRAGDSVIVQVSGPGEEFEAYIKIYEKRVGEWIVCRQINPAAEVRFAAKQIAAIHRVLTTNELFRA